MDPKTTNKPTNQNNVDTEMGTFDKIEAYIKNAIFGVLFVLLKDHEMSIYTCFIITCIQFIQLLILPFHATINETWNSSDIVDVLQTAFNYLNIVPYMNDTNFNLYATFFYLGVSFLIVGLVLFFYVSYTVNQKSQIFAWPVIILKYICILITTILFLPLIDYFVSVLACVKNEEGVSVHSMFSEIECWTGVHSLAAGFAIFGIILLLVMSSIFSMTYFEYRDVASDPTARTNARPNFLVLAYKTVMIIFLTFLTGTDFQILLIIMILIGSAILFWKFYLSSPYHNEIISKQWSTFTAVNLWTAVMLVFAKIMETSLFEGSIIAWLLGIPFVAMIILANRDPRIGLLLMNVNKFQSGQEVQDQIRYLLKLISWQATNRNSAILLDGYIEIHKQSCNKNDCPLKQKVSKNNRFTKNLMSHDETLNEKYAALIQLLYGMFSYGIRKFPNNTSLRIAYAFFLLEKMQSKQQALQELTQAEKNKPPFDEQFVIYRYKKIVEDEIAESQNEGQGLDVVSEGAFQTQLRILQANIEKCALLHMEFWSQLAEENPDLAKLNDNGSKINTAVQNVEENWTKLIKINNTNTKAMRLYGKFLIEVINDKEAGEDLLEKARNLMNAQLNTHKKGAQMGGANGDDAGNDAAPAVWVSGEQDKFGLITGINLTAASLFGYNKTELLNRKMNALMPQLFAKHHDSFLEHYMNTGEGAIVGKNKERLAFGKNKSNYIFPMYYSLRVVQSIIQGIQFMATFRIEKNFKNAAYVLTHPDGTIDSISSSAISLLKVDLKVISQKKGNIQDLFPNIIKDKQAIFSNSNAGRSTAVLNYSYPRDSEYLLDEDPNIQLNCYLNELVFLAGRENAGFQFRFERLVDKSVSTNIKAKISNFQFKFDLMRMVIVGEYADPPTNSDIQSSQQDEILGGMNRSDAGSSDPGKDIFGFSKKKEKNEEQVEVEVEKIDYAKGIRTLRLVDGRAVEINDDNDEDEEEGELSSKDSSQGGSKHQQLSQQEEDPQEEGSLNDFSTTFKSRKALTTVVNDKTPPQSVRGLRLIINLLGLLFLAIALTDYILCKKEFDKINNQIELLDMSNQRLAEMMTALSKIRDLYLVNINILDDDRATLQSELQAALDSAKAIKQDLESQVSTLSTAHLNLLNQPVIKLSGIDTAEMKGLTQAADEVITRAYDLVTDNVSAISPTNADYYFVTYNLMNNFYQGLKNSSQYYALELTDQVDGKASTFLLLLIGSIVALVIALVILSPILLQVNKSRDEILSLFLDIPDKTVKTLYAKCETFVQNLQIGEEEDMASEIDEDDMENKAQEADNNSEFTARKKKKKFKNSGRGQHSFFIRFLLVTAVLEGYFVYTYVSSNYVLSNVATMVTELNATSVAESFFSFANNAERQLFINDSGLFPVLNIAPEDVTTSNIILMLDLDSLILEEHSVNRDIQSSDYTNTFNQIMLSEPCPLLTSYVGLATCEAFADQTVYQGMTVALARHIENMRTLLSCYSKIRLNPSYACNAQPADPVDTGSGNSTYETILNLMRTSQAYEMSKMQEPYIKGSFRTLMTSFKKGIKEAFDDQLTTKLIIFLIYIVCLLFVYGVLWQSLIRKINTDIWRTKSMLNMIPIHVIARIRSIRFYLKKFWNERNLAEV